MDILKRPGRYPTIAIQYTDTQDPFFELNVMLSLDMIAKSATMKKIFKRIKDAQPGHRPHIWPRFCNVLITPPIDRSYTSGVAEGGFKGGARGQQIYDDWRAGGPNAGLSLRMSAKCQAQADNKKLGSYDITGTTRGTGTIGYLYFSNREVFTKSGEALPMYTTMAHELIHCMHFLYGETMWTSRDEEHRTVGLKAFMDEELCENKIRQDLGVNLRQKYFADD